MADIVILDLLGGVALLLWGLHMVHSGFVRAFGSDLRRILGTALRNRFRAFLAGVLPAPRRAARPQAHSFAHLFGRLSGTRAYRRTRAKPAAAARVGVSAEPARPGRSRSWR
jgi:hypothetical protein